MSSSQAITRDRQFYVNTINCLRVPAFISALFVIIGAIAKYHIPGCPSALASTLWIGGTVALAALVIVLICKGRQAEKASSEKSNQNALEGDLILDEKTIERGHAGES